MTEFYRFIKSKGYRMRHSLFFPVHILIPLVGIFLYLAYMGLRQAGVWEHLTTYVTLLAMAYPAIAGIVKMCIRDRGSVPGRRLSRKRCNSGTFFAGHFIFCGAFQCYVRRMHGSAGTVQG